MQTTIKRIIFFLLLILLWQGIVALQIWPESMISGSISVFKSIYNGMMDLTLIYDIVDSFRHLLIGLLISIWVGNGLVLLLVKYNTADETLGTMVLALLSVPSIVWLPLAIIWFGFGETSIIFVIVIGGTFVMTMNVRTGIKNVTPIYIDAAQTMGSKGFDLFLHVILPASIPHAVTGLRLA